MNTSRPPTSAPAGPRSAAAACNRSRSTLRAVPDNGFAYGLLRHLNPETATGPRPTRGPQVSCQLHVGRFTVPSRGADTNRPWTGSRSPATVARRPWTRAWRAPHPLMINAVTVDSSDGSELSATFTGPEARLTRDAVQDLADAWLAALAAIGAHAESPAPAAAPPATRLVDSPTGRSPDSRTTTRTGRRLALSPLQEGMLFHSLADQHGPHERLHRPDGAAPRRLRGRKALRARGDSACWNATQNLRRAFHTRASTDGPDHRGRHRAPWQDVICPHSPMPMPMPHWTTS
ncbi:hypothetical protein [Streptomyces thioluteus]|uniref:hypothetical protein n=1 Tax=Streptomyces thioluteus TaxID=66431 RepID=UPI0031E80D3E